MIKKSHKARPNIRLLRSCVHLLGGVSKTAKKLGYGTHWGVGRWFHKDRGIPTEKVGDFVALCRRHGIDVTCHQLRPDKFPADTPVKRGAGKRSHDGARA